MFTVAFSVTILFILVISVVVGIGILIVSKKTKKPINVQLWLGGIIGIGISIYLCFMHFYRDNSLQFALYPLVVSAILFSRLLINKKKNNN
ncbi:hypothetical protein [Paenibacillus oryzisoli]|uniref:Uncharacterized protein n=1 Tax=Paenibacillus oryzisoli TaxID=1850517 RepID=A0A198AE14_9BACL|nr:hypothetical protein [Paenibacillus oryzisoli]OAS19296.1 hypothetical protein A8708_26675 [Paenibacillus oryzisoli]